MMGSSADPANKQLPVTKGDKFWFARKLARIGGANCESN
jgi:hypothetical protein